MQGRKDQLGLQASLYDAAAQIDKLQGDRPLTSQKHRREGLPHYREVLEDPAKLRA